MELLKAVRAFFFFFKFFNPDFMLDEVMNVAWSLILFIFFSSKLVAKRARREN